MIIEFNSIGHVSTHIKEQTDINWGVVESKIIINEELADGLKGLTDFSHIIVVYYLHEAKFIKEKHLTRRPQGRDDMPIVGLFSQRVKDRPNPIGITSAELLDVNRNIITVRGLDAIDGTPILDIKPYFPVFDRKSEAKVPNWVNILMKQYF